MLIVLLHANSGAIMQVIFVNLSGIFVVRPLGLQGDNVYGTCVKLKARRPDLVAVQLSLVHKVTSYV